MTREPPDRRGNPTPNWGILPQDGRPRSFDASLEFDSARVALRPRPGPLCLWIGPPPDSGVEQRGVTRPTTVAARRPSRTRTGADAFRPGPHDRRGSRFPRGSPDPKRHPPGIEPAALDWTRRRHGEVSGASLAGRVTVGCHRVATGRPRRAVWPRRGCDTPSSQPRDERPTTNHPGAVKCVVETRTPLKMQHRRSQFHVNDRAGELFLQVGRT